MPNGQTHAWRSITAPKIFQGSKIDAILRSELYISNVCANIQKTDIVLKLAPTNEL